MVARASRTTSAPSTSNEAGIAQGRQPQQVLAACSPNPDPLPPRNLPVGSAARVPHDEGGAAVGISSATTTPCRRAWRRTCSEEG